MTTRIDAIENRIKGKITLDRLGKIDCWQGIEDFAEKIEIAQIEFDTPVVGEKKWSARGLVVTRLINRDGEKFGEIQLLLSASGHFEGTQVQVDCLEIASYQQ